VAREPELKDEDRTMKLSLIFASSLVCLAAFATGCGTSDENNQNNTPTTTEQPPAEQPPANASGRQLIDGKQLPTSAVNLLADPGFAAQQGGYGAFLAFYDGSYEQLELETTIDSRSPSGFGGAVALIRPAGATDTKSEPVILLTSFLGGAGPFHAQIWVSKSDIKGAPVEVPTDGSAVKVSVADGDPDAGESFDLKPVDGASRTVAGRTWLLYKADITKPLANGGFFVIRTGAKGGHIHLAAPEVTSDQVAVGQAVMRASAFSVTARTKTAAEKAAIKKYRAIPPRLTPAAPKVRIGK
jgi:hypothetical protein